MKVAYEDELSAAFVSRRIGVYRDVCGEACGAQFEARVISKLTVKGLALEVGSRCFACTLCTCSFIKSCFRFV